MIYQAGETARLQAAITDINGADATPAAIRITIEKPNGVVVIDDVDMQTEVVAVYYYDYLLPVGLLGEYKYSVKAIGGDGRITISRDSFDVEAAI